MIKELYAGNDSELSLVYSNVRIHKDDFKVIYS
jgi:hypothetical protein